MALFICSAAPAATGYQNLDSAATEVKIPQRVSMVALVSSGHRLIAAGVHGVIIVSDDSGRTWRQAAVPVDVTLTSLYFSSAGEGWATGHYGVVLHSTDGGWTWHLVLTGLDVINAMRGAADEMQTSQPDTPATILQTKVANFFARGGPDQPFLTIGQCGNGILAAGAKDMAMFSTDDGKSWRDWTPNIDNPHFRMIYDLLGYGGHPVLLGETGWMASGDPGCRRFELTAPTSMPTLFGGVPMRSGALLVFGLNGTVATTLDLSQTWQTAVGIPQEEIITSALILPNGEVIAAALSGAMYIGNSAGAAFHRVAASVPFQAADLAMAPDGDLVVAGNGGIAVLPAATVR